MSTKQARKPKGTPVGGQFDRTLGGGPATNLGDTESAVLRGAAGELESVAPEVSDDGEPEELETIYEDGTRVWHDANGRPHRDNGPAVIDPDGTEIWMQHGLLHNEHGPAIKRPNGYEAYWVKGEQHRLDGPAIKEPDGSETWMSHGKIHRDKLPARTLSNGVQEYWQAGVCMGRVDPRGDKIIGTHRVETDTHGLVTVKISENSDDGFDDGLPRHAWSLVDGGGMELSWGTLSPFETEKYDNGDLNLKNWTEDTLSLLGEE